MYEKHLRVPFEARKFGESLEKVFVEYRKRVPVEEPGEDPKPQLISCGAWYNILIPLENGNRRVQIYSRSGSPTVVRDVTNIEETFTVEGKDREDVLTACLHIANPMPQAPQG